jgi:hypothetical protein
MIAGDGKPAAGERVLQLLSGERRADVPRQAPTGALRLITDQHGAAAPVRRPDPRDADPRPRQGRRPARRSATGRRSTTTSRANRDRDMLRQQLSFQAEQWGRAVLSVAGGTWPAGTISGATGGCGSTCAQRRRALRATGVAGRERRSSFVLLAVLGVFGEAAWWASRNNLPFELHGAEAALVLPGRSPAIRRCRRWWTSRREASRWAVCRDATTSKARPAARTTSRIR